MPPATRGKRSRPEYRKVHSGKWTEEEHRLFLEAIERYGNMWKSVENHVGTRTCAQIRSHSQKYFQGVRAKALEELRRTGQLKNRVFIVIKEYRNYTGSQTSSGIIDSSSGNYPITPSKSHVIEDNKYQPNNQPMESKQESACESNMQDDGQDYSDVPNLLESEPSKNVSKTLQSDYKHETEPTFNTEIRLIPLCEEFQPDALFEKFPPIEEGVPDLFPYNENEEENDDDQEIYYSEKRKCLDSCYEQDSHLLETRFEK